MICSRLYLKTYFINKEIEIISSEPYKTNEFSLLRINMKLKDTFCFKDLLITFGIERYETFYFCHIFHIILNIFVELPIIESRRFPAYTMMVHYSKKKKKKKDAATVHSQGSPQSAVFHSSRLLLEVTATLTELLLAMARLWTYAPFTPLFLPMLACCGNVI